MPSCQVKEGKKKGDENPKEASQKECGKFYLFTV